MEKWAFARRYRKTCRWARFFAQDALRFGLIDNISPTFDSFLGWRARRIMSKDNEIGRVNVVLPPATKSFKDIISGSVEVFLNRLAREILKNISLN